MQTLQQRLEKVNLLSKSNLLDAAFNFLRTIEDEIVRLNRQQLNEDSEDTFGKPIGFYSASTEFITGGVKKRGEPFDMKDTGDFLNSIYANVSKNQITFISLDSKAEILYQSDHFLSNDFLGLSDKNLKAVVRNELLPFMITFILKVLSQ